jgi:hypothetical protein
MSELIQIFAELPLDNMRSINRHVTLDTNFSMLLRLCIAIIKHHSFNYFGSSSKFRSVS